MMWRLQLAVRDSVRHYHYGKRTAARQARSPFKQAVQHPMRRRKPVPFPQFPRLRPYAETRDNAGYEMQPKDKLSEAHRQKL